MEALGLIGIVDENVGINPGNSLENSWSIVLAVVDANKYIVESQVEIVMNELSDIALFVACDRDDVATIGCDCLSES